MRDTSNWKTWEDTKREWLKDPAFRREYERRRPQRELAVFLVGLRIKNHWTQHQLAQKLGLKQSEISLMEAGERNVSLKTLQRIAETAGKQVSIQFLEPARAGRV